MHSTELTDVEDVTIGVLEAALHGRRGGKQVVVIGDAKKRDIDSLVKQVMGRISKPERRRLSMSRCDIKKAVRVVLEQLKRLNVILVHKNQWVLSPHRFREWCNADKIVDTGRQHKRVNSPQSYINRPPAPSKS